MKLQRGALFPDRGPGGRAGRRGGRQPGRCRRGVGGERPPGAEGKSDGLSRFLVIFIHSPEK
jgi:hypothetical protein